MARREDILKPVSLLTFLHPSDGAARLSLINEGTDTTYPFAIVDDSAPFSRVIRAAFLTPAGSRLKDIFLILQRDQYRLDTTAFKAATNSDIEAEWQNRYTQKVSILNRSTLIDLVLQGDTNGLQEYAPLLYCREKQLFTPILCPSCAKDLELCRDEALLEQKGLHGYAASARRYLYCPSCCSRGRSEFYLRERLDSDPLFLLEWTDLLGRFRAIDGVTLSNDEFPCPNCDERSNCYGSQNSVRTRLLPFSFYPFFLLIVEAPTLNVLDFSSLISGSSADSLLKQFDHRIFPGRAASLNVFLDSGSLKLTHFVQGDVRAFSELLFLKLSLLEEAVGRIAANSSTQLQLDGVWVYLPNISNNMPLGWNFRLLFLDDLTQSLPTELEKNPAMALARAGLFYFQILLSNSEIGGKNIIEAVSQYLSDSPETSDAPSILKTFCIPASLFANSGRCVMQPQDEEFWNRVCLAGFDLLNAASGKGAKKSIEIHQELRGLLGEVGENLFGNPQSTLHENNDLPADSDCKVTGDDKQVRPIIRRVITDMINDCRSAISNTQDARPIPVSTPMNLTPEDHSDEVVETVMLRAGTLQAVTAVSLESSSNDTATIILSTPVIAQESPVEATIVQVDELQETVLISPRQRSVGVGQEVPQAQPPQIPSSLSTEEESDDLAETVMIVPTNKNRPPGIR